jgi:hypothetical protein
MPASDTNKTALLALVVGVGLEASDPHRDSSQSVESKTTRELAVLVRILEKRLGELRRSLVTEPPPIDTNTMALPQRLVGPGHVSDTKTRHSRVLGP